MTGLRLNPLVCGLLVVFGLLASGPALGSAALFTSASDTALSSVSEVILVAAEGTTEVEYLVEYTGDASSLGWIIPIPGEVETVSEGDVADFETFHSLSHPVLELDEEDDGGSEEKRGCACRAEDEDPLDPDAVYGVALDGEVWNGQYGTEVFEPSQQAEMLSWISDNNWEAGDIFSGLQGYAALDYQFVAVKLIPSSSTTPEEGRQLVPIRVQYASEELTIPTQLVWLTEVEDYRITIFIEGDRRARVLLKTDWTETLIDTVTLDEGTHPDDGYEDALWEIGGDTAQLGLVYSDTTDTAETVWLTRFDAWAGPDAWLADPEFELKGEKKAADTVIEYAGSTQESGWLFLPLLGCGWYQRRKRTG